MAVIMCGSKVEMDDSVWFTATLTIDAVQLRVPKAPIPSSLDFEATLNQSAGSRDPNEAIPNSH